MGVEHLDLGSVKWVPIVVARKTLRVSRQRVYQLIKAGRLAAIRVDGQLMVSSASIMDRRLRMMSDVGGNYGNW